MFIDYKKIDDSINFYLKHGFERIEAPWWVPENILNITKPSDAPEENYYLKKNNKCLVASAEQSFLYMANQGLLPKGKFQATTPCFRDEIQGEFKRKFFIKNELIITDDVNPEKLKEVISLCFDFFKTQVNHPELLKIIPIDDTFDIVYNNIELGSYGIRSTHFVSWIFATGCAEPRLSRAISKTNFELSQNKK